MAKEEGKINHIPELPAASRQLPVPYYKSDTLSSLCLPTSCLLIQ